MTDTRLATSIDEALSIADELGYPVALKVVADEITHKTDVGGVELGIGDADELRAAAERIHAAVTAAVPGVRAAGISVQPMSAPGTEVILGITQDQQFGPVLMFGLGVVFVEVLKDVAFRVVPLEPRDAGEMIRENSGLPRARGLPRRRRRRPRRARSDAAATVLVRRSPPRSGRARPQPRLRPRRRRDRGRRGASCSPPATPERRAKTMPVTRERLHRTLNPEVVAVIGDKQASGYNWLRSLQTFTGKLYSVQVDPNEIPGIEAMGIENYASLTDIPERVDFAVCAVPRNVAPFIVQSCVDADVGGVTLFTSGFEETGEELGLQLQNRIHEIAGPSGLALIGPNCMGGAHPAARRALQPRPAARCRRQHRLHLAVGHARDELLADGRRRTGSTAPRWSRSATGSSSKRPTTSTIWPTTITPK